MIGRTGDLRVTEGGHFGRWMWRMSILVIRFYPREGRLGHLGVAPGRRVGVSATMDHHGDLHMMGELSHVLWTKKGWWSSCCPGCGAWFVLVTLVSRMGFLVTCLWRLIVYMTWDITTGHTVSLILTAGPIGSGRLGYDVRLCKGTWRRIPWPETLEKTWQR